jgi:glycosyltransferase involved in cell wall biosynthesis
VKIVTATHSMASVGGTELNVFQVARGLASRGHAVNMVAARGGDLEPSYRTFCQSVTRLPPVDFARSTVARDLLRMAPAVAVTAAKRADVIYPNRFAELIWAVTAGRLSRAPVVCHLHEIRHKRPGSLPNAHVRRFIAVSESLRSEWVGIGLNPELIEVVHNGVSLEDYPYGGLDERTAARRALGLPEQAFVALYYGRLDREKGVDVLLDAWGRLGMEGDEGKLLLVGSASAHLADGAREVEWLREKEPPNCVWLPAQPDVVTPLHAADVVVLPSVWSDPLPRVVIESMATGRPVLASRVGGIPEMLSGEFTRFLFENRDAAALAEGLRQLVGWRTNEPGLGEACRNHVRDHFSFDAMVTGIEKVLLSAADAS